MFQDFFDDLSSNYEFFLSPIGLFIISMLEAFISPIPPEVLLIPLCILYPNSAIFFGIITTIASVLGALIGYWIGLKGGRYLLMKITKQSLVDKAEYYYNKYGAWAIGLAAFTPIPFKVFTITSGALRYKSLYKFILASAIGRAARFLSVSFILMVYGEAILNYIQDSFQFWVLFFTGIIITVIFFVKKFG
ncbi:MAG: DedA family protein [Candidatus Bathyarchaeota archaeon]|nr:DedA family protein [Candidatus Bathyarchaeota archaeon]